MLRIVKHTRCFKTQGEESDITLAACYELCPVISPQCAFLIWCMAPVSCNGSAVIYQQVIRPFFLKHQAAMDNAVNDLSSKAKSVSENAAKKGETPLSCIRTHSHDLFEYQSATHADSQTSLFASRRRLYDSDKSHKLYH